MSSNNVVIFVGLVPNLLININPWYTIIGAPDQVDLNEERTKVAPRHGVGTGKRQKGERAVKTAEEGQRALRTYQGHRRF